MFSAVFIGLQMQLLELELDQKERDRIQALPLDERIAAWGLYDKAQKRKEAARKEARAEEKIERRHRELCDAIRYSGRGWW